MCSQKKLAVLELIVRESSYMTSIQMVIYENKGSSIDMYILRK